MKSALEIAKWRIEHLDREHISEADILAEAVVRLESELRSMTERYEAKWKQSDEWTVSKMGQQSLAIKEAEGLLSWALLESCDLDLGGEINAWRSKYGTKE